MTDAERAELRKRMEKAQSAPIRFPIRADPATVLSLLDSLDAAIAERDRLRAESEAVIARAITGEGPEKSYASVPEMLADMTRRFKEEAEEENARLRAALNEIACWSDGPEVSGKFDEPSSARIARAALESP